MSLPRVLTLVAAEGESLPEAASLGNPAGATLGEMRLIEPGRVVEYALFGEAEPIDIARAVGAALGTRRVDYAVQTDLLRRKMLVVSDMDSTLIAQECLDELGALAGLGEKIAAITARAMQGELDFVAALTERVALLKDASTELLERVWAERITLMPGAATLMATMKHAGALNVLVSGGFTFFTDRVAAKLGMDAAFGNTLPVDNGRILGQIEPPILDKMGKLQVLKAQAQHRGVGLTESLALGDGANDIPMLQAAGLGVACHAKPAVREATAASLIHNDLTAVLYFQGIPAKEWVRA